METLNLAPPTLPALALSALALPMLALPALAMPTLASRREEALRAPHFLEEEEEAAGEVTKDKILSSMIRNSLALFSGIARELNLKKQK